MHCRIGCRGLRRTGFCGWDQSRVGERAALAGALERELISSPVVRRQTRTHRHRQLAGCRGGEARRIGGGRSVEDCAGAGGVPPEIPRRMCVIARERQGNRSVRGVVGHLERRVAVCKGGGRRHVPAGKGEVFEVYDIVSR